MSVKASISLTDAQDEYARSLVAAGKYSSLSAVMQRGLELLRQETEEREAETAALRALLAQRSLGPFVSVEEGRARTQRMLERKKAEHGLSG